LSRPPPSRIRRAFDAVIYGVIALFAALARLLGPRFAYGFTSLAGRLWFRLFRKRRRIIHRNLEIAFGDRLDVRERDRIGRACCASALATLADMALRDRLVTPASWRDHFIVDAALEQALTSEHPRGLAVLSAHLGSWESGQFLCGLRGKPMSPVVRRLDNARLERLATRLRTRYGGKVISRDGALRGILEELRAGGSVAIMPDQAAPVGEPHLDFFGVPAATYVSHARALVRSGCTVLFSVCLREGGGFRFRFHSRLLSAPAEGSEDERALALVRAYLAALEDAIRSWPEQYLWMHRRWKRTAPQLGDVYAERRG
jgi:KDO2-lipid IV(A) lauroyltransferase